MSERNTVNVWDSVEGRAVNVPGHPLDRRPDMDTDEARRTCLRGEFDGVENSDLPLLRSDMRTDPCEGTHGHYEKVVRLEDADMSRTEKCDECYSKYGVQAEETFAGLGCIKCLLCDAWIEDWL